LDSKGYIINETIDITLKKRVRDGLVYDFYMILRYKVSWMVKRKKKVWYFLLTKINILPH